MLKSPIRALVIRNKPSTFQSKQTAEKNAKSVADRVDLLVRALGGRGRLRARGCCRCLFGSASGSLLGSASGSLLGCASL